MGKQKVFQFIVQPFLFFNLVIFLAITFPGTPAFACQPTPTAVGSTPTPATITNRIKAAQFVFEGTISTDLSLYNNSGSILFIKVHQYLKGVGPATIKIHGLLLDNLCAASVSTNERLLFYADGNPNVVLEAQYFNTRRAWEYLDAKTLAEAIDVSGQKPLVIDEVPNSPMPNIAEVSTKKINEQNNEDSGVILIAILVGSVALIILGGFIYLIRDNHRN